ncbi:MAG: hypothetical protein ABIZ81_01805 [Opitutaceae bacterium]
MITVSSSAADRTVVVRSVIDPAYAARRAANPERVETYVFARGQYYNPIPMDRYLERMEFHTIAATIASDLRKDRYKPVSSILAADLVLAVHWGATQPNETSANSALHDFELMREASNAVNEARERIEDPEERRKETARSTIGEAGFLDVIMEAQTNFRQESANTLSAHTDNENRRQTNVELLGLQSAVYESEQSVFNSALGDTVRHMINEERYFVIVMAYDGPAMREGRKKRLWTTRASIRGPGVNFADALDRLSSAAGAIHGTPQGALVFASGQARKRKEAEVQVGEFKVLGDPSAPTPARADR